MKDIDFDELDRAVNSLISPGKVSPTAEPDDTTSPIVSSTPTTADQLHTTVSPPLAERRSSGRFMDVVHPSSDMRTSPAPRPPLNHTEMTITPPDPVVLDPQPEVENTEQTETSTTTYDSARDTPAPLESPFLSDAKVEKRPLGAFSNGTPEVELKPTEALLEASNPEVAEEKPDEQPNKSDHPMETDTPLPAELQDNLLSIEANEDTEIKRNEADEVPPTVAIPVEATSIAAQYTEQPSTGDQPAGAVFDTEAYKKPMVHPKKKSGWLIVLWIFLLLVVGAGVGAAIYFLVLPKL